ncbi:hypothetical protein MMC25_005807 [Agyrium rufum]|nr:hypothetical protein [Agyrium rufum]
MTSEVTVFSTLTETISLVGPPVSTSDQGPYFFSVISSSTVWAGGRTPPISISQILSTSTVLVSPVPFISFSVSATTTVLPLTITITETETHTVTETLPGASHKPVKTFTHHWHNHTLYVASTSQGSASRSPIGTVTQPKDKPTPSNLASHKMHIRARQLGVVVTATINGVVVSWTNEYGGPPVPTTSLTPTIQAPTPISVSVTSATLSPSTLSEFAVSVEPPPLHHKSSRSGSKTKSVITSPADFTPTASVTFTAISVIQSPSTTDSNLIMPMVATTLATVSTLSTSTAVSPTCSVRGNPNNVGDFEINFDDLPRFGAPPNDTDYPPLFSPYHHLAWAQGYAYAPPPKDPYQPISPPRLAVFVTDQNANVHSSNTTDGDGEANGAFGVGLALDNDALYFNVYSTNIGCQNAGPSQCQIRILGYIYEPYFQNQAVDAEQVFYQDPCPSLMNCALLPVTLNDEFLNLTTLQIIATVDDQPVTWYMDNLQVGWSNNSCEAVEIRQRLK